MVRCINGKFYVLSSSSNKIYIVTKDLECNCKGFQRYKHCKHQSEVEKYILSGATVDIARTPIIKDKWA